MLLSGCAPPKTDDFKSGLPNNFTILEIEGCEYIQYDASSGQARVYSLTHKGNCKNPIHKSAQ